MKLSDLLVVGVFLMAPNCYAAATVATQIVEIQKSNANSSPFAKVDKLSALLKVQMAKGDPLCYKTDCRSILDAESQIVSSTFEPRAAALFEKDFFAYLENLKSSPSKFEAISTYGVVLTESYFGAGLLNAGIGVAKKLVNHLRSINSGLGLIADKMDQEIYRHDTEILQYSVILGKYDQAADALKAIKAAESEATSAERRFWLLYHSCELDIYTGKYSEAGKKISDLEKLVGAAPKQGQWLNLAWVQILASQLARAKGAVNDAEAIARSTIASPAATSFPASKIWAIQPLAQALRRGGKIAEASKVADDFLAASSVSLREKDSRRFYPLYEVYADAALQKHLDVMQSTRGKITAVLAGTDLADLTKDFLAFWDAYAKGNTAAARSSLDAIAKRFGNFHPDYLDLKAVSL